MWEVAGRGRAGTGTGVRHPTNAARATAQRAGNAAALMLLLALQMARDVQGSTKSYCTSKGMTERQNDTLRSAPSNKKWSPV